MNVKSGLFCVSIFVTAALTDQAAASDDTVSRFLGNPLLALASLIVLVGIAMAYRRIRK